MQFLLTEEEYEALLKRATAGDKAPKPEHLQQLCTVVANHVPVQAGLMKGKPWGCIITVKDLTYCDECPAQGLCPYPYKRWSK